MFYINKLPILISVGTSETKGKTILLHELFCIKKCSKGYLGDGLITISLNTIETS